MTITLVDITNESESDMTEAGMVRVGSFATRADFEAAVTFQPELPGPYRATENGTFDIWADDPSPHE